MWIFSMTGIIYFLTGYFCSPPNRLIILQHTFSFKFFKRSGWFTINKPEQKMQSRKLHVIAFHFFSIKWNNDNKNI
jgi:hypothetical protein